MAGAADEVPYYERLFDRWVREGGGADADR
jgi:hypothetical protein